MDPGGTVRTWNLGGKRIHGYAADEIIGHHFSRFYPPKVVERGTPSLELELARIDGQYQAEEWRVRAEEMARLIGCARHATSLRQQCGEWCLLRASPPQHTQY